MIQSVHGSMLIIPRERKLTRFYVQMAEVEASSGRDARASINPATIFAQAKKVLAPYTLDYKYCDWWTAYQVGQRVSNGYQDKTSRILLAGDAGMMTLRHIDGTRLLTRCDKSTRTVPKLVKAQH